MQDSTLLSIQHQALLQFLTNSPNQTNDLDTEIKTILHSGTSAPAPIPIKVGDWVTALYNDGYWYPAQITKLLSRGRYQLLFDGYSTKEIVLHDNLERMPTAKEIETQETTHYNQKVALINYLSPKEHIYTTLLILMAELGHYDCVCWLLQNDANVELRDRSGCTALMRAAESGNLAIVVALLEYEASYIKRCTLTHQSAYDMAKYNNHLDVVQYFEEKTRAEGIASERME